MIGPQAKKEWIQTDFLHYRFLLRIPRVQMSRILTRAEMLNIKKTVAAVILVLGPRLAYADILTTAASVRPNNSLIADIEVTTASSAAKLGVTYETPGVDPLISRLNPVSSSGTTIITIGRLRAERTYTYTVRAIDDHGSPAGTARGSFTTGSLPAALLANRYTHNGRTTAPLVILPHAEANFKGYVGLDLHSPDAPQIVWYYSNGPSKASGGQTVDQVLALVQDRHRNFLMADAASNPPPDSADAFYREIKPDGTVLSESPADCSLTPPASLPAPMGWVWAQGNDVHEQLVAGARRSPRHSSSPCEDCERPVLRCWACPSGHTAADGHWNPTMDPSNWRGHHRLGPVRIYGSPHRENGCGEFRPGS
jgi:hypothetical protein